MELFLQVVQDNKLLSVSVFMTEFGFSTFKNVRDNTYGLLLEIHKLPETPSLVMASNSE